MDQSLQKKEDRALARKGLIYSELSVSEIPMWQLPGKGKVTPDSLSKIVFRMTEMNGQVVKVPIKVSPSAEWGYPTVLDLEYFRAFERALTMAWQRDGMVPDVLRISGREMIRLTGKAPNGDRQKEVRDFFERMSGLQLVAHSAKNGKRGTRQGVHIFERFDQEESPDDHNEPRWAHEIRLADWYWANLNNFHCHIQDQQLFLALQRDLTKLLYQHLHGLFRVGRGAASEAYSELAVNLSLKRLSSFSEVSRQLGPAHEELVALGFVGQWKIERVLSTRGEFTVTWEAGPAWHQVYSTEQQLLHAVEQGSRREDMLLPAEPELVSSIELSEDAQGVLKEIYDFVGNHDHAFEPFWKKVAGSFTSPVRRRVIAEVRELAMSRQIRTTRARALVSAFQREGQRQRLAGWSRSDVSRKRVR